VNSPAWRGAAPERRQVSIAHARLTNQAIGGRHRLGVADVVRRLGAVQAQDYLGALWALGVRQREATQRTIEAAIDTGAIVRTWPMRGTLHFVPAVDARWMLDLLTPRVLARNAGRYRELELDAETFDRARRAAERALEKEGRLTRPAFYKRLADAGIDCSGARGLHILGYLAQRAVICFGPREGKQPTLVLLNDWVRDSRRLSREEALAELAGRYFASHGPATLQDFVWWSGLPVRDARAGIAMNDGVFGHDLVADTPHFRVRDSRPPARPSADAHLLPPFDELIVAYRDRRAVVDPQFVPKLGLGGVMSPTILVNGRVVGSWGRRLSRQGVHVRLRPFVRLRRAEKEAVLGAATRYASFLALTPHIEWSAPVV
jgi:winged helix DNA-binding protein